MPRCANPDCPDADRSDLAMRHHWVQLHEVDLQQIGHQEMAGTMRHLFAAVTCSKRCAVAVLTTELPAEEAERERVRSLFRSADSG